MSSRILIYLLGHHLPVQQSMNLAPSRIARWIVVDANLVNHELMLCAVGAALMEGDRLQVFRAEGIDRGRVKFGHRNPYLNPLSRGKIASEFAESLGSGDFSPLWSGQNASGCKEIPAAQLTRDLAADL